MKKLLLLLPFLFSGISFQTIAQEDCPLPTAFEQLDINNVRANYYNSGLDWINRPMGRSGYEVPKNSMINSIFGGRMWIGGIDETGTLRVNVGRFNQVEHEYSLRAGPMNHTSPGNFETADCLNQDHMYKINRSEVELHRLYFDMLAENGGVTPTGSPFESGYTIPENILNWPAHAEVIPGQTQELAPYFDNDCCGGTPGIYEPELGDYPAFRFPDNEDQFDCEEHLLGDQVLWWVVNDAMGEFQWSEYTFLPLGIEIQNMAYAYITDDQLNNTTFLRRTIINRSGWEYSDVYLGQFIDVDLGGPNDDFFGNDVERGMSYYYNGDNNDQDDGGALGYGISPPAIGFSWVGGPLADEDDGIDNNFNGIVDEPNERLRMYHSMQFNNSVGPLATQTPIVPHHFYSYLRGKWRNDSTLTYGGIGYGLNSIDSITCLIAFPGDSDPLLINTHGVAVEPWSEITENNSPGDRRNIMSSGPFTFLPNEEKVFTLAIPWARQDNCEEIPCSLELLREANDMAQELHDNCYELPCMVLDAEIEIEIENGSAFLSSPITSGVEYHWTFGDGESMTTSSPFASHQYTQAGDFSVCLEIDYGCGTSSTCQSVGGQLCDLMTGPELTQIEGTGNTQHYFELTDETLEAIWANDSNMVIHPTYKKGKGPVKVLAYDTDAIVEGEYTLMFDSTHADANWKMFIQGTTDTVYSELPIGSANAQYIEQWGLMVSVDAHLSDENSAPIGSKMIFENESLPWLTHVYDVDNFTYQDWIREGNTFISCFSDEFDNCYFTDSLQTTPSACIFSDILPSSASEDGFESLIDGGWAPSYYVNKRSCHPFFDGGTSLYTNHIKPGNTRNVDIVLTSDKDKWTRSAVIDLSYGDDVSSYPELRSVLSVDKNGRNQNDPNCNTEEATFFGLQTDDFGMSHGMGWFPGYAIDVNTGKRLNIVFGENPDLVDDNGNDMIWNPTSKMWDEDGSIIFGGTHSVIVLSNHYNFGSAETSSMSEYNGCQQIFEVSFPAAMNFELRRKQQWTGLPILNEGFELLPIEEGLIPTETTIQLRLRHRYQNYLPGEVNINNGNPLYNFTIDYEDLISNVDETSSEQKIMLYPNPATDQLHIQLTGFEQQLHDVQIFSLAGKLVKSETFSSTTQNTVDIGSLPNGVYILKLASADGKNTAHSRFVVVR